MELPALEHIETYSQEDVTDNITSDLGSTLITNVQRKCDIIKPVNILGPLEALNYPTSVLKKGGDNQTYNFRCSVCSKIFSHKDNLNTHMLIHTGTKPHQCTFCDKLFTQIGHLKKHIESHSRQTKWKCELCDKQFSRESSYAKHSLEHLGIKPYKCTVCEKEFTQRSCLRVHTLIHDGIKKHKCEVCDKAFTQKPHLTKHRLVHTGDKPYQCYVCNKLFTQAGHLKTHQRVHSDIRPHQCSICDKYFKLSSDLTRHVKTHTGIKKHKCTFCDKTFVQSCQLKTHLRIHTGGTPYKCILCTDGFRYQRDLTKHIQQCHSSLEENDHIIFDDTESVNQEEATGSTSNNEQGEGIVSLLRVSDDISDVEQCSVVKGLGKSNVTFSDMSTSSSEQMDNNNQCTNINDSNEGIFVDVKPKIGSEVPSIISSPALGESEDKPALLDSTSIPASPKSTVHSEVRECVSIEYTTDSKSLETNATMYDDVFVKHEPVDPL